MPKAFSHAGLLYRGIGNTHGFLHRAFLQPKTHRYSLVVVAFNDILQLCTSTHFFAHATHSQLVWRKSYARRAIRQISYEIVYHRVAHSYEIEIRAIRYNAGITSAFTVSYEMLNHVQSLCYTIRLIDRHIGYFSNKRI